MSVKRIKSIKELAKATKPELVKNVLANRNSKKNTEDVARREYYIACREKEGTITSEGLNYRFNY